MYSIIGPPSYNLIEFNSSKSRRWKALLIVSKWILSVFQETHGSKIYERVENIFFTTHVDEVGSFDATLNYFISFSYNWNIGPS